ncbi:hypothetical protein Dvina_05595 [Dactylosporangium vinaceum]|uniref:LigA protein n=1 Tax=Dactylosporangium vinaceum TaxID=53362 RepID=A0ABV5MIH6_9ACTN|nr:hypothetical protein [Dactylosporangium vinaceum]UAB97616.1 hypothetical protein Dvina_05595 [Dactylosporangium vinaceum]
MTAPATTTTVSAATPGSAGTGSAATSTTPGDSGVPAAPGGDGAAGGSWDQAGRAVSDRGAGTARNEHWKSAARIHGVQGDQVHGDKVGRDKIVLNLADKTVDVFELPIELLEPVRNAFVNPDRWIELSGRFADKRTAIVRGRTGRGKDAAAIRLLIAEVETIYLLDPATDITHLAGSITRRTEEHGRADRGIGFLLCQPKGAAHLGGWSFHALENALSAANARLVVTLSPDIVLADDGLEPYVLDLGDNPVPHRKIVLSHLRWQCSDQETFERLSSDAVVDELIVELEHGAQSCQAAADLARLIIDEHDEGAVNAARVHERRRRHQDHAFDQWFDRLRAADERSFAIALAVLDGLPYEDVAAAARMLRTRLEVSQQVVLTGGDKPELRVVRRELMPNPVGRLLDTLRAAERDEVARYEYGTVPVHVVAYRDGSYPLKVIERVWRGYQIQPTLLGWLHDLIRGRSDRVRFYAASTLGVLCRYSFDYVWTNWLAGWADHEDHRIREAVAYALREPAADAKLVPSVNMVVGACYGDVSSPLSQATAARAFGVCVGQPDATAAIDRLGRLATIDDYDIAVAIGDGLADLILSDADRMAPTVCAALVEWFGDKSRTRSAELAFLMLASTLVSWDRDESDGPEVQWPLLLRLADTLQDLQGPLRALWRHLISNSVLHDEANAVLTGWAALAENNRPQLLALLRLIRSVVREPAPDPRSRRNLARLVKTWTEPRNLNPLPNAQRAMTALLDKLEREGS